MVGTFVWCGVGPIYCMIFFYPRSSKFHVRSVYTYIHSLYTYSTSCQWNHAKTSHSDIYFLRTSSIASGRLSRRDNFFVSVGSQPSLERRSGFTNMFPPSNDQPSGDGEMNTSELRFPRLTVTERINNFSGHWAGATLFGNALAVQILFERMS